MTPAELERGAALYAAKPSAARAQALADWLNDNLAALLAAARQAQDNAKDAEPGEFSWKRLAIANDRELIQLREKHIFAVGLLAEIDRAGIVWAEMKPKIDAAITAATPGAK